MDEQEFNSLINNGSIKTEEVKPSDNSVDSLDKNNEIESFIPELTAIRRLKQDSDSVPTYTPKNFIDQFYLYLSGSTRKLYVWINKGWLALETAVTDHGALTGLNDNDHGAVYYTETEIDNFTVKLTGDQSVAGIKTFTSFPITPSSAPTTNYQVANKKYVDDNAGDIPITLPFSGKTGNFTYSADTPIQTITYNPTTKTIVAMAALQGEFGEAFICRYGTNGVEGNFTLLDAFEMDIGAFYTFYGSVQVGNYIYTSIDIEGGSPEEIIRRTDLDGANAANMTISGNDDLNMQGMLVTDGTYIYIRISTTQYQKLTISGTTLTASGAITFSNGFQIDNGFGCDGTTLFGFDGGDNNIYGFTASDGTVTYQQAIAYPQEINGILYINSKFYTATVGYGSEGSNYSHPTSIHLSRINIAAY